MRARLHRWVKKALVSLLIEDETTYPRVQLRYNGVTTDAYRFSPYGLASQPPVNSLALILSPDGRRDDPVAIIDGPLTRFKELKEGEVAVGNPETKTHIKFNRTKGLELSVAPDGNLVVSVAGGNADIDVQGNVDLTASGNVSITAPTVQITGNLTVSGTVTGQTNVIGGPTNVSLATHTHNENGDGGGVTNPPNP